MPILDEPTKTGATMIEKTALIIATDIPASKGDINGYEENSPAKTTKAARSVAKHANDSSAWEDKVG